MAKYLRVGELIDRTLTIREQARVLTRMRDALYAEEARIQAQRRRQAARRRDRTHRSTLEARAMKAKQKRLLALLQTSTDPDVLRRARTTLAQDYSDPETRSIVEHGREQDTAALIAQHTRGPAAYWAILGPAPHCQPGDVDTAKVFYRKIQQAMDRGGWSRGERASLYDLLAKWGPRSDGTDARFMAVGTLGGRLPKALEEKIKELRMSGMV